MTFWTLLIINADKKGVKIFTTERAAVKCWVENVFLTKTNRRAFMKKYDEGGLEAVKDLLRAHTGKRDVYILEKQELHFPARAEQLLSAWRFVADESHRGNAGRVDVLNELNEIMMFLK